MALQQDQALETNPLYVLFALLFILFGLAVIAAVLNLMLLKFMTMNTIDENRSSFLIALFVHFEININTINNFLYLYTSLKVCGIICQNIGYRTHIYWAII